jgi:hypothetical protein
MANQSDDQFEGEQSPHDSPQTEPAPLARRAVLAERLDLAGMWMMSAVLGALLISVISEQAPLLRMSGPLTIMACYVAVALSRSRFSTTKVADSVYFMGFLWTLWALIDLLVIGGKKLAAQDLYAAFGYALTATAAGMFCRLSILQFFRTVDDQEHEAVDSIDMHVRTLATELEKSSQTIAELRGVAAARLLEWHGEFTAAGHKHLTAVTKLAEDLESEGKGLSESLKTVRTSVDATSRTFGTLEKRVATLSVKVAAELDNAVLAFENSLRALTTRVAEINVPPDLLTGAVRAAVQDVTAAAAELTKLAVGVMDDLKRSVEDLSGAAKKLPKSSELDAAIVATISQFAGVSTSCSSFTLELSKLTAALSASESVIKSTQEISIQRAAELEGHIRVVQADLVAVQTTIQSVRGGATKAADTLREVVNFVDRQLAN